MSDEQTPADAPNSPQPAAQEGASPRIRVLAQFTKDLSFENPGLLSSAQGQNTPEIELGIDVRVDPGPPQEKVFGVDLRLSATAKRQDKIVFIIELVYSGIFQLQDVSPNDIEPLLLIECPRLLFPFARRVVADITRDGGHPPLMIDPIDFVGLYQKQMAERATAEPNGGGESQ